MRDRTTKSLSPVLTLLLMSTSALAGCSSSSGSGISTLGGDGGDASLSSETGSTTDPDANFSVDFGTLESAIPDAISAEAFWAGDPPPAVCGDGVPVPVPGGTVDCPSDKNREGCPCDTKDQVAPCWPGKRANRNHGVCKDGTTKCVQDGEFGLKWAACSGYQLPSGTTGKSACTCFSAGSWNLKNLSPCFFRDGTGAVTSAVSTLPNYDAKGDAHPACPTDGTVAPTDAWTSTTLKVDCAGHFKLCYTLKAGDAKNPQPSDCTVTQQCAEDTYATANVLQTWKSLAGWLSTDATCASQFDSAGGYGEMSVLGTSVECDHVEKVFQRVPYCSSSCNANPTAPGCAGCSAGGGGTF